MILQSVMLGLHLVCVNLASAGPLLCPLLQWRSSGDDALARVGRRLVAWSLVAFFVGGAVGLLHGWMWWKSAPDRLAGALERLSSKVHFGLWELAFYVACMAIYWAWWKFSPPRRVAAKLAHALLAFMAATNLLWHFPPLMTILVHTAANAPTGDAITSSEFRSLMFSATILPRCVHVWLASLAVAGISLALLAALERRKNLSDSPALERATRTGGHIALIATLLQALVGAWVLFASPSLEQSRLMGGNIWATLLLLASVAAALWLMHLLATIAMGEIELKQLFTAAAIMTLVIFTMSATLMLARGNVLHAPLDAQQTYSSPNRIWQ
jgi:hypothetical protein